jgi:hypothetical protein
MEMEEAKKALKEAVLMRCLHRRTMMAITR